MEYFFNEHESHESHEFNKREGLREAENIRQIRQIGYAELKVRGRKRKRRTPWDEEKLTTPSSKGWLRRAKGAVGHK